MKENYNDGYYHFRRDVELYPDANMYIVWSARSEGKTYSFLRYTYDEHIPIIYMKRTNDDVDLITTNEDGFDASPYVPLNRDYGYNVKGKTIKKGIGGFWDANVDGDFEGAPISYTFSLNALKKIKGLELSRFDFVCLDEFIPLNGEVVRHAEGLMFADIIATCQRDRVKRGLPPTKIVLFANCEDVSCPITREFNLIDTMSDMNALRIPYVYDEERGILFHLITESESPKNEENLKGIYQVMKGTDWYSKSVKAEFAQNDFSNVNKKVLKEYKPLMHIRYKSNDYYVYRNPNGRLYMCNNPSKCRIEYDLNKENDQKRFYAERLFGLQQSLINGKFDFQKYSMYDLICNYKKFFKI